MTHAERSFSRVFATDLPCCRLDVRSALREIHDEGALTKPEESGALGALEHMKLLSALVPEAFRAIVLLQGGDPVAAVEAVKKAAPRIHEAPHAIYCRAYDEDKQSYLGFVDEVAGKFRVHAHEKDRLSPLAGFLRMVVGYMAARGIMSGALLPMLRPHEEDHKIDCALGGPIASLYAPVQSRYNGRGTMHERFSSFVDSWRKVQNVMEGSISTVVSVFPAPSVEADGRPSLEAAFMPRSFHRAPS